MITANRQAEILRGQTSCAQRVFSLSRHKASEHNPDTSGACAYRYPHRQGKIMGSLKSLIDSGLVTEKGSSFQRAEIKRAA